MRFNKCLLLLAGVLMLAGCGDQYNLYKEDNAGISIKYPKDWSVIEKSNGTIVAFVSPKSGGIDAFQENVNIVIQNLSAKPMTLKQYSTIAVNQLKQVIANVSNVTETDVNLAGYPAHKVEYEVKAEFTLKMIQIWTVVDKWAYMFTFTGDADVYKTVEPTIEAMIKSLKIEGSPK